MSGVMRALAFLMSFWTVVYGIEPVIVLFGPPGSGKGTFSQYLKEQREYHHISAGDLIRKEIELETEIGRQVQEIVARGEYVNPEVMFSLIRQAITKDAQDGKGLIVDGFVRTMRDLDALYQLICALDLYDRTFVLCFEVDDAVCRERIANRLVCSHCGHVYNVRTSPPLVAMRCDICRAELTQRLNDSPEAIERRITNYRRSVVGGYQSAITLFPHLTYNTDRSLSSCERDYAHFAQNLARFNGTARLFVEAMRGGIPSSE